MWTIRGVKEKKSLNEYLPFLNRQSMVVNFEQRVHGPLYMFNLPLPKLTWHFMVHVIKNAETSHVLPTSQSLKPLAGISHFRPSIWWVQSISWRQSFLKVGLKTFCNQFYNIQYRMNLFQLLKSMYFVYIWIKLNCWMNF